jgi:hypothetical protein
MSNDNTTSTPTGSSNFIDLHARGMGYLSRIRKVSPKKGASFLAATISAFHGEKGSDMTYVKFDCRVSGAEADTVAGKLMEDANNRDKKVVIGFKIGDFYLDSFTYEKGEKAGQQGTVLKGRLLKIYWANVDGKRVFTAESSKESNAESTDA